MHIITEDPVSYAANPLVEQVQSAAGVAGSGIARRLLGVENPGGESRGIGGVRGVACATRSPQEEPVQSFPRSLLIAAKVCTCR